MLAMFILTMPPRHAAIFYARHALILLRALTLRYAAYFRALPLLISCHA